MQQLIDQKDASFDYKRRSTSVMRGANKSLATNSEVGDVAGSLDVVYDRLEELQV